MNVTTSIRKGADFSIRHWFLVGIMCLMGSISLMMVSSSTGKAAPGVNPINSAQCGANLILDPETGKCETKGSVDTITNLLRTIIHWFSVVVGFVAVIMLIFGGFKYILSSGSTDNVNAAKNTILYAIVGLVIVGLAQIIVNVVLEETSNVSEGSSSTSCTHKHLPNEDDAGHNHLDINNLPPDHIHTAEQPACQ